MLSLPAASLLGSEGGVTYSDEQAQIFQTDLWRILNLGHVTEGSIGDQAFFFYALTILLLISAVHRLKVAAGWQGTSAQFSYNRHLFLSFNTLTGKTYFLEIRRKEIEEASLASTSAGSSQSPTSYRGGIHGWITITRINLRPTVGHCRTAINWVLVVRQPLSSIILK